MSNEPGSTPRLMHCPGCRMEIAAPIVVGESIECFCAHHHLLLADGSIATRDPIAGPHPSIDEAATSEPITISDDERISHVVTD